MGLFGETKVKKNEELEAEIKELKRRVNNQENDSYELWKVFGYLLNYLKVEVKHEIGKVEKK